MTLFDLIHFTRPYWLVLIAAIVLLTLFVNKNPLVNNRINKLIDPNLRQHLVYKDATRHLNKWLGLAVAISLCLGLAGISWTKAQALSLRTPAKPSWWLTSLCLCMPLTSNLIDKLNSNRACETF